MVNREALWQILRMHDVGGKLLNGIKSMYFNNKSCVRVRGSESECFRIDSGVRQRFIMSPWFFYVYMDVLLKEVKMGRGRRGMRFQEEGRDWRLFGLLYADDLYADD